LCVGLFVYKLFVCAMDVEEHKRDGWEISGSKRQKFHKKSNFGNPDSSNDSLVYR